MPIDQVADFASEFVSQGNQTGEGWLLTGEMVELIVSGAPNIVCCQPFGCLPNHIVGKGVIKELKNKYPEANIVAIDFDPGASAVNQVNRIKLMLSTAKQNLKGGSDQDIDDTPYSKTDENSFISAVTGEPISVSPVRSKTFTDAVTK